MSEVVLPERSRKFTLGIARPVVNFGPDSAVRMENAISPPARRSDREGKILKKVFRAAHSPQVELISPMEVIHVRREFGIPGSAVSKGHNEELVDYLKAAMAATSGELRAPISSHDKNPFGRGQLISAGANPGLAEEREQAKQALLDYYGMDSVPDELWFDDERATTVWLARSVNESKDYIIEQLDKKLKAEPELLPAEFVLGKIAVETFDTQHTARG